MAEQNMNPAHPDLTRFMQSVGAEDLSRPNLFLVRFSNIATTINEDGVLDFTFNTVNNENEGLLSQWQYMSGQAKDIAMDAILQTDIGSKVMGAYNPKIIKTLLPGEFVDGLLPSGFDINRDLAILIKAVSIPGISFSTDHSFVDKKPFTTVSGRTTDTITMTFYLRTNHAERMVMQTWMNMVQDPFTNEFGFYDSYAKDIEIYPLTRQGYPLSVTKCTGCFPVKISNVSYDTDANNAVATFDVEFAVSTTQSKAFEGSSPFYDTAASLTENVFTNPLVGNIF